MSTSRRVLGLAWIPLVVWAASIFVAEHAFRLAGVRAAGTIQGIYEPFGDGSFRLRPGSHLFQNWFSGPFNIYTDRHGFRVGDPAGPVGGDAPADVDVLVLGDSQAFGQGLDYEQTVVGGFAVRAERAGLSVANAAIGGHFLRNQLELLRWHIREQGLRPRVVLVCLTPRSLGIPEGFNRSEVHHGALFASKPSRKTMAKLWLASNSSVYLVVRDAMARVRGKSAGASESLLGLYRAGEVQAERTAALAGLLGDLKEELGEQGAGLVLCYLPLAAEGLVPELAARAGEAEGAVKASAPMEIARDLATGLGVPMIDVSPALEATRQAGEPVSLDGDPHFGAGASDRCGEMIWSAVDWAALARGGGIGAGRGAGQEGD